MPKLKSGKLKNKTKYDRSGFSFLFSLVMPVYNSDLYLEAAIDGIIRQDIGFCDEVQLILVDDGSTDKSGIICDIYKEKYPRNIIVLHQKNAGVSSARNTGLNFCEGRFIGFPDSDDILSKNTLSSVYDFFNSYEQETDIVTVPIKYFGQRNGNHWQSYKFLNGNRVINIIQEYDMILTSCSSSFFSNRCKKFIKFDEALVSAEDAKVILEVISEKLTLGVVTDCCYYYRTRTAGQESLSQSAAKKRSWYFEHFYNFVYWAKHFSEEKFGFFAYFFQYIVMADFQWRFMLKYNYEETLSSHEFNCYQKMLFESLIWIDDDIILQQKILPIEYICRILEIKHRKKLSVFHYNSDAFLHINNKFICKMSDSAVKIDFIKIADNKLFVEGIVELKGISKEDIINIYFCCNGTFFNCSIAENEYNKLIIDMLLCRQISFKFESPEIYSGEMKSFEIYLEINNNIIKLNKLDFEKFCPVTNLIESSYLYENNCIVTCDKSSISVSSSKNKLTKFIYEMRFTKSLLKSRKKPFIKGAFIRILYRISHYFVTRNIWLISDRVDRADDNGEAFFKYVSGISSRSKAAKAYFIIDKQSPDVKRLKSIGRVINFLSWKHKFMFLLSESVFSSQAEDYVFNPFRSKTASAPYKDIISRKKFVFLQHGVIHNDLSLWLNKRAKNIDMFVTTTVPEYRSIMEYDYSYDENVVFLTGLPRHDSLYNDSKKYITVMPTWRKYLQEYIDKDFNKLADRFYESDYYFQYSALINSQILLNAADSLGYKIRFMPHPNMSSFRDAFICDSRVEILPENEPYSKIFAESALIVTDYSSIAFDFAYLRKPVLYFQFDKEKFFDGSHTSSEGYFDFECDAFGEVSYELSALIKYIIEYMESGCKLKEKYRKIIDGTFPFNDNKNCERVYKKHLEL